MKQPKQITTASLIADLELKVKRANGAFIAALRAEESAKRAASTAHASLNEAQRALDAHVSELHNSAHRDSYWKR